jgi:hypothetical protein
MIYCTGFFCSWGGLQEGENPQDDTWEQALNPLVFEDDFSAFSMEFMLVPNRAPSRSYTSWGGTLDSIVCQ